MSWSQFPDPSEILKSAAEAGSTEKVEEEPASATPVQPGQGHLLPTVPETRYHGIEYGDDGTGGFAHHVPAGQSILQTGTEPLLPLDNRQTNRGQVYPSNTDTGRAATEHAETGDSNNGSGGLGHIDTSPSGNEQVDTDANDSDPSDGDNDEESGDTNDDDDHPDVGAPDSREQFRSEQAGHGHDNGHTNPGPSESEHQFGHEQSGVGYDNAHIKAGPLEIAPLDTASLNTGQEFAYNQPGIEYGHGRTDAEPLDASQPFTYDQRGSGHHNEGTTAGALNSGQQLGRPLSPSDVVMIRRGGGGSPYGESQTSSTRYVRSGICLHELLTWPYSPIEAQPNAGSYYSGQVAQTEVSPSRAHKRAVSAPDFPVLRDPGLPAAYGQDVPTTYGREAQAHSAYGREMQPTYGDQPSYGSQPAYGGSQSAYGGSQSLYGGTQPAYGQESGYDRGIRDMQHSWTNPAGSSFSASGTASHHPLQTVHENTYARPHRVRVAHSEESEDDEEEEQDDDINKKTKLTLAPRSVLDNLDAAPRCMFVKECKTGSQLRKAISHIFGRNKICTRQIPDNIWVHFCRKHYQRCRYRNVTEYAKLQCQLVVKQIERVQAWSDRNDSRKQLGVVSGWTMGIRKREQKRMAAKRNPNTSPLAGKKRPFPGYDLQGMEGQEPRPLKSPHAVPDWLLEKCGKNFSTEEVIEIFRQIESDLDADRMREIPDIEVLPSITHDPNEEIQYKRYEKRKHMESQMLHDQTTHRRAVSAGNAWYPVGSSLSQYNPSSASGFWGSSQGTQGMTQGAGYPYEKRQRVGDFDGGFQPQTQNPDVVPRSDSRTVPTWRPGPFTGSSYLPAPVAQRPGTQSTAQQLESSTTTGFNDYLRQPHQRSQSDTSSFRHLPPVGSDPPASRFTAVNSSNLSTPGYPPRSSSSYYQPEPTRQSGSLTGTQQSHGHGFGAGTSGHSYSGSTYGGSTLGQSPSYNDYPPRQQHPSFSSGPTSYYQQSDQAASTAGRQGHARHQSTPAISQTSQQMYGSGSSFHSTVVPEGYPPDTQPYGQSRLSHFGSGQSREDVDE
jgi:hypothetical protein